MKRKLMILLFLTFFLLPFSVSAKEAFDITKYDVDIVVNENNTLDITEDITVFFNESRHGIVREIPLKSTATREDGTSTTIKAKVKNIRVNNSFSKYKENGSMNIKIGSASTLVDGEINYKIEYNYDLGKEKNKDFDELYFNIIGSSWDTTIDDITFTIHMPKEFDQEKFGISTGAYGTSGTENMDITFEDNDIIGKYYGRLNNYEAMTVRIELEDGYFVRVDRFAFVNYIVIIGAVIFALYGFSLWNKNGRDRDIVETVEFYAPDGLNSAELGYVHKLSSKDTDIVSLLIYLANKGYLRIEEKDTKGKNFTIIKVKDYDGDNEIEEKFLDDLFSSKDEVKKSDLQDKFYRTINTLKYKIAKNKYEYYEKSSTTSRIKLFITIIVTLALITIKPLLDEGELISVIIPLITSLPTIIIYSAIFSIIRKSKNSIGIMITAFMFMPAILTMIIGLLASILSIEGEYLLVTFICLVSVAFQILFFAIMGRRTEKGVELEGKIRGFKDFLENAEKEKLEELVLDDPSYFYNILPYTYVLGLSNKWIKKFESIALQQPDWYVSSNMDTFDPNRFNKNLSNTIKTARTAMTSMPQSSGGSGGSSWSGGGGFSGGGHGGGGGHSW